MTILRILILFSILVLSSCKTIVTYVEPQPHIPSAELTIYIPSKTYMNVGIVSYPYGIVAESDGHFIGRLNSKVPFTETKQEIKKRVQADTEFIFSSKIANYLPGPESNTLETRVCKTMTSFMPETGKRYIATLYTTPDVNCRMKLEEIYGDGNKRIPVPSAKELPWCLDPFLDPAGIVRKYPDKVCKS